MTKNLFHHPRKYNYTSLATKLQAERGRSGRLTNTFVVRGMPRTTNGLVKRPETNGPRSVFFSKDVVVSG
jgi:hypothetical protein